MSSGTSIDKRMTPDEIAGRIRSGMTIGVGGWGSRRKPMAIIRALLRSDVADLTVVAMGGPEVGLLCEAGKVRKVVFGFVTLDSVPLEPQFRQAREAGRVEITEIDEGMLVTGLRAAGQRVDFMPTRAGLGSSVMDLNEGLRTVRSPYSDEEYVAMPALNLDVALLHFHRADVRGNCQYLNGDPFFDDMLAFAAETTYVSCEQIVPTDQLLAEGPLQSLLLSRMHVAGVAETPNGAHFTDCVPDYRRDEAFQRHYVAASKDPAQWQAFKERFLSGDEAAYQAAVASFAEEATVAKAAAATRTKEAERPMPGQPGPGPSKEATK